MINPPPRRTFTRYKSSYRRNNNSPPTSEYLPNYGKNEKQRMRKMCIFEKVGPWPPGSAATGLLGVSMTENIVVSKIPKTPKQLA